MVGLREKEGVMGVGDWGMGDNEFFFGEDNNKFLPKRRAF